MIKDEFFKLQAHYIARRPFQYFLAFFLSSVFLKSVIKKCFDINNIIAFNIIGNRTNSNKINQQKPKKLILFILGLITITSILFAQLLRVTFPDKVAIKGIAGSLFENISTLFIIINMDFLLSNNTASVVTRPEPSNSVYGIAQSLYLIIAKHLCEYVIFFVYKALSLKFIKNEGPLYASLKPIFFNNGIYHLVLLTLIIDIIAVLSAYAVKLVSRTENAQAPPEAPPKAEEPPPKAEEPPPKAEPPQTEASKQKHTILFDGTSDVLPDVPYVASDVLPYVPYVASDVVASDAGDSDDYVASDACDSDDNDTYHDCLTGAEKEKVTEDVSFERTWCQ